MSYLNKFLSRYHSQKTQFYTDKGFREQNEDVFYFNDSKGIYLLCDGMGGRPAGKLAATLTKDIMLEFLDELSQKDKHESLSDEAYKKYLQYAVAQTNEMISNMGAVDSTKNFGSTLSVYIKRDREKRESKKDFFISVGDTTMLIINPKSLSLEYITTPHISSNFSYYSLPEEKQLVEKSRSALRSSIGMKTAGFQMDIFSKTLDKDDYVLMYTDGFDVVRPNDLLEILSQEDSLHWIDSILYRFNHPRRTTRLINILNKKYPAYDMNIAELLSDNKTLLVIGGK